MVRGQSVAIWALNSKYLPQVPAKMTGNRTCPGERVFEKGWDQMLQKQSINLCTKDSLEKNLFLDKVLLKHNLLAGLCSGRYICSDAARAGLNSGKKFWTSFEPHKFWLCLCPVTLRSQNCSYAKNNLPAAFIFDLLIKQIVRSLSWGLCS